MITPLLIYEPETGLDVKSEASVLRAPDNFPRGRRTSTTQRLSIIEAAGCICMFERESIVVSGTKGEPLQNCRKFARLSHLKPTGAPGVVDSCPCEGGREIDSWRGSI